MNKRIKETLYLICIVTFIFISLCIYYKIYPLSSNLFNGFDGGQQTVPMLYHIWDFLHLKKALVFDWYTAFGNNLSANIISNGFLSPFNLLLLLTKRENIQYIFTFMIYFRFLALSFSMYYFIDKRIDSLPWMIKILMSIIYTYNGFTLQYYITPMFIDHAILFPLIIDSTLDILYEKKSYRFILLVSLSFIISINTEWAILSYIVIFFSLHLIIYKIKNKNICSDLGIKTLFSIFIPSIILIPGVIKIFQSSRMSDAITLNILDNIKQINYSNYKKWRMISVLGIPFYFGINSFFQKTKKDKNLIIYFILSIITLIPIVIEGSNLFWHLGKYISFPMRYGFIMFFSIIVFGCYGYINTFRSKNFIKTKNYKKIVTIICFIITLITMIILIYFGDNKLAYLNLLLFLIICFLMLIIPDNLNILNYIYIILGVLNILIVGINYMYILPKEDTIISPVYNSTMIYQTVKDNNYLNRIKIIDNSFQHNYPLVLSRSSSSNYLHFIDESLIEFTRKLGYAQEHTRLSDSGSTIISDSIFNYVDIISKHKQNTQIYEFKDKINDISIYKSKYALPIGKVLEKTVIKTYLTDDRMENQKIISDVFYDDDIIQIIKLSNKKNYEFYVKNQSQLYLDIFFEGINDAYYSLSNKQIEIRLNNIEVNIPDLNNLNNKGFPSESFNGIINLGIFENQNIKIEIITNSQFDINSTIGLVDIKSFENILKKSNQAKILNQNERGLSISVISTKDNFLFLPIYADNGWNAFVNGKEVKIEKLFGQLMLIPLNNGENIVSIIYKPPGQKFGFYASMISIFILLIYINLFNKLKENKLINNISKIMLDFCFVIIIVFSTILPIIYFILYFIEKLT